MRICKHCGKNENEVRWVTTRGKNHGFVCRQCANAVYYAKVLADPQAFKEACKIRYWRNPEKSISQCRKWNTENPGLRLANTKRNELRKKSRVPAWANHVEIAKIYVLAAEMSRTTGVKHNVDHIIPLKGKLVSGLHVENNLQIITETANKVKKNRFVVT